MRSYRVDTDRLRMLLVESGGEDGIPVVLLHGYLSTGRCFEHLFADAPEMGKLGAVPGWPGEAIFAPQPMVAQIRAVLERYAAAGGRVASELFDGSGHFPPIDGRERWSARFFGFLESVE